MINRRWEMVCDQRGCWNRIEAMFKQDLKDLAKGLGWTRVRRLLSGSMHTCPECQERARTGKGKERD